MKLCFYFGKVKICALSINSKVAPYMPDGNLELPSFVTTEHLDMTKIRISTLMQLIHALPRFSGNRDFQQKSRFHSK
jgi:hypothetical protein